LADAWLVWLAGVVALAFVILLTIAGYAAVGLFLGVVIWLAARSAATPDARSSVDGSLRRTCDRVPFCDCGS
jgi:hypothetical protein